MYGEVIAIAFIVLIIGGAAAYIIKAKKNGNKCIGCPYGRSCSGKCSQKEANGQEQKQSPK